MGTKKRDSKKKVGWINFDEWRFQKEWEANRLHLRLKIEQNERSSKEKALQKDEDKEHPKDC